MKAAIYHEYERPIRIESLPDPAPATDGVVVKVEANGVCRSDWHGWMGHDPDIVLPHVPGHELAGVVVAVGADVSGCKVGDRVTAPFICACGTCRECEEGNQQVCAHQEQPGFTHWGAFAEFVALRYADTNLVALPESMDFVTAAALGCRFATSYRAVTVHADVTEGQWLAVHGCGGIGLSAVMIAAASGAKVLAVDIDDAKLAFARDVGAIEVLRADRVTDMVSAVADLTDGGAHASIDAIGGVTTMTNSIASLRRRGRHVQVGLMVGEARAAVVPMARVVAEELELIGSHGMQAHAYPEMLELCTSGAMDPSRLIGRRVDLAEGARLLETQEAFAGVGVTVIDTF